MKKIGLILLGSLVGCVSDQIDSSEKTTLQRIVKTTRVANLEDCDLFQAKGLVKSGKTIISISPTNDYNAVSIDLESIRMRRFFQRRFSENDNMFQIRSLNSCPGGSVTALDFRKGRVIETEILPSTHSVGEISETIIQLPPDQQHLAAAKTSCFVLGTGLYAEGRYMIYSLADHTARYSLSYPDHAQYPSLQETTKGMLYASSVLRVRPDESAFVCADMYSGVIDFCRIHTDTIKRVKLVRLHYPKVEISETTNQRVTYNKDKALVNYSVVNWLLSR